jgi:DNA-binding response OmpR family regulator
MGLKLLIIEDDEHISSLLQRSFSEYNHSVQITDNGEDGEYLALQNSYDVIILDWMLPLKSGVELLANLRKKQIQTPVIMLSAKADIDDKVQGLEYGADDYLPKPFSFKELRARVEALYRRTLPSVSNILHVKDLQIDLNKKTVSKNGKVQELTRKEYELLLFLVKNQNAIISHTMIEEQLWNEDEFINSNVIQVTIYTLRKKLGKELIKSLRGLGYQLAL